jgi:hypothetical protein
MSALQCWETADRARALRSKEAREALITLGINALSQQFLAAVYAPDMKLVLLPTPDFADSIGGTEQMTALDLISDMLADAQGGEYLQQMVKMIAAASCGATVQMQAQVLLARLAGVYAGRHGAAYAVGEDA